MILTTWGYSVDGTLSDFITAEEYNAFTAGKFAGDARIASNIAAATAAVRNYCGWHLYPELPCELATTFFDRRVSDVRNGILIQIPSKHVAEITGLTIGGEDCDSYMLDPNGLLKVYHAPSHAEYTPIVVHYTSGIPDVLMGAIRELVSQRVTHALASSYGVTSEAAGGVSITYNAAWTRDTGSTGLGEIDKEVLSPYRIGGMF